MWLKQACVAAAVVLCAGSAVSAGEYHPVAFGPTPGAPAGTYFTSVGDIAADGKSFYGTLSSGAYVAVSPVRTFNLASLPNSMSSDGARMVGGISSTPTQQFVISHNVAGLVSGENLPRPGTSTAPNGSARNIAKNGDFSYLDATSAAWAATTSGLVSSKAAFQNAGGTAGAYRGLADDAPVMVLLGTLPGDVTNAYRWNYASNTFGALARPSGAGSTEVGSTGNAVSSDAGIIGGSATFGAFTRPYWWDAAGAAHAVPSYGAFAPLGSMLTVNYTGTLGGGGMTGVGLGGNHAFLYDFSSDATYDLNVLFAAQIPAGWVLTFTQHISDDGSKIFCSAIAPDGSSRAVELDGTYSIPAPSAAALLGLGGLAGMRRRRR